MSGGSAGKPQLSAWRHGDACVILRFRLTPKSSKDRIDGLIDTVDGPALQAHVRAIPENGAANAALERLVAEWLDVSKRSVALIAGGTSRLKTIRVDGEPGDLERRLRGILADQIATTPEGGEPGSGKDVRGANHRRQTDRG